MFQRGGRGGDARGNDQHDRGMPQGEEEADGHRALSILHQLARDVVDRGDVICVDRVPQAEAVGEQARGE